MGLWVNTTYINEGRVEVVADALAALAHAEGMAHVEPPPQRERLLVEPMQYEPALFNDLWGVALFPGADGWTVIQTAPLELLGERAADAPRMRLSRLCRALAVPAFQFNLYDGTESVLVEVAHDGAVLVSGVNPQSRWGEPLLWNGEPIDEENHETGFRLLPLGDEIDACPSAEGMAAAIAHRFGGGNARYCDNLVSVDTLICHKPFDAAGGSVCYFAWKGPSRQRYAPLASWDAWRALSLPE